MIKFDDDDGTLFAELDEALRIDERRAMHALEAIGIEATNWLRSLTAEMVPPAGSRLVVRADGTSHLYTPPRHRGEGERQAHPGHWADVTGQLALSYGYEVLRVGAGVWMLELHNTSEYAEALENRSGYWVLEGVYAAPEVEAIIAKHLEPLATPTAAGPGVATPATPGPATPATSAPPPAP